MINIIEQPIQATMLPVWLLQKMPDVSVNNFIRIAYEILDENGFTEVQATELRQAINESHDPKNLIGPFCDKKALDYLRSLDNDAQS